MSTQVEQTVTAENTETVITTQEAPVLNGAVVNGSEASAISADSSESAVDSSVIAASASAITADSSAITADSSAMAADSSAMAADSSGITADSSAITADSSAITADSSAITADSPASAADSSAITAESPASAADSSAITADSPAEAVNGASDNNEEEPKKRKRRRRRRRRGGARKGRPLDSFKADDELEGVVRSVQPYGAFVDVGAERDGLIHISELRDGFVEKVEDVIKEGERISVRVKEVQVEQGRLSLTMRSAESQAEDARREARRKRTRLRDLNEGDEFTGSVSSIVDFGAFIDIGAVTDGLVHISEISDERVTRVSDILEEGQEVKVRILGVDKKRKRISLSMREPQPAEEEYTYKPQQYNQQQYQQQPQQQQQRPQRRQGQKPGRQQEQVPQENADGELPSAMQIAFARASARKKQRNKDDVPQSDNPLEEIIARMLSGSS